MTKKASNLIPEPAPVKPLPTPAPPRLVTTPEVLKVWVALKSYCDATYIIGVYSSEPQAKQALDDSTYGHIAGPLEINAKPLAEEKAECLI